MKKLKLLLDVDEVIFFTSFLKYINEFLNTNYKIDDFTNYYIDEEAIPKDRFDEFKAYVRDKNLFEDAIELPGAIDAIKRLSTKYDIYLVTDSRNIFDVAHSAKVFHDRFNELYNAFKEDIIPVKNYCITGQKSIFKADVQVDDLLRNLSSDCDLKILFPSYHNKNVTDEELKNANAIRAGYDYKTGWIELEKILNDFYDKKCL